MKRDDPSPFAREPWRRLLEARGIAPPETTDARIQAAARRALASRTRRWWIPASLAATGLLAALLVQRQVSEPQPRGVLRESQVAEQTGDAPVADAVSGGEDDLRVEQSRAKGVGADPAPGPDAAEGSTAGPETAAPESTPPRAPVGGPERELQELNEMAFPDAREEANVPSPDSPPAGMTQAPRERQADPPQAVAPTAPYRQSAAKLAAPEDWYARIEKLRAEGRHAEADRELERLEDAYPGWLERHLEETKRR